MTAKFRELHEEEEAVFRHSILELAVLTVRIVALAVSLLLLRKKGAVAARAESQGWLSVVGGARHRARMGKRLPAANRRNRCG